MNAPLRRSLLLSPVAVGLVLLAVLWPRMPQQEMSLPVLLDTRVEATRGAPPSVIPSAHAAAPASAAAEEAAASPSRRAPVPMPVPLEDPPVFRLFNLWAATYTNAKPAERAAIVPAGVALATERRQALAELIPADPQRALGLAVPFGIRQKLPPEIVEKLEERVSAKAFFGVLATPPDGKGGPAIKREVRLENGKNYNAYVFGRRLTQPTTKNAVIAGIAVDRVMAVDHRPMRVLEAGEVPERGKKMFENSPISGRSVTIARNNGRLPNIPKETTAVQVAGAMHSLSAGRHIQTFEGQLMAAEGEIGGLQDLTGTVPDSQSTGMRSLLIMRVAFPESNREISIEAEAHKLARDTSDWFLDNSFGDVYLTPTVTPLLILPRTEAWYSAADTGSDEVLEDARVAGQLAGFHPAQYDLDCVLLTGDGKGCWLKTHEFGHNFGLWHVNFWNTSGASVISAGSLVE